MNEIKFSITTGTEEEPKTTEYLVVKPNLKQQREAQKVYNRAFKDAVESGALLRDRLSDFITEQGMWNDEKETELISLQKQISESERKLAEGGISLSDAKSIALNIKKLRIEVTQLVSVRSRMDQNTAEGQADNARFNFLVSSCLVYNKTKKPVYGSLDAYLNDISSEVANKGAESLAKMMFGLSSDFESQLPENKFLSEFNFVDEDLRLVDDKGRFVDEEGRLIDENGRFINEEGEFVDIDGNRVDENGDFVVERKPFLDEDGNPIG